MMRTPSKLLLCVLLLWPALASAQQASGIAGVVKDASGAVLPGVTVEASSPALIEKVRTVVTDGEESKDYRLPTAGEVRAAIESEARKRRISRSEKSGICHRLSCCWWRGKPFGSSFADRLASLVERSGALAFSKARCDRATDRGSKWLTSRAIDRR